MIDRRFFATAALVLALPVMLSACADVPNNPTQRAEYDAVNDPLEPMNRTIFDVNDFLDTYLIRPAAISYRYIVPEFVRNRIAGILSNMKEPVIFANNLLQGEFGRAGTTVERFGINSTLGLAGMWDVAEAWDMNQQTGDFGQTLYSWGINAGPYLVLPLFGPSNFRDAIGLGADSAASPWSHIARIDSNVTATREQIAEFTATGLTRRTENLDAYDSLKKSSIDFYAQLRSVYRQYRDKELGNASTAGMPKFDDYK